MRLVMLSTNDNKYDPTVDFDRWLAEDCYLAFINHRRDTCSKLALEARTSTKLSDESNFEEIERAIDQIVLDDPLNVFIKVVRETKD